MRQTWRSTLLLLGLIALTGPGSAAYRCQGADGKVTYSDRACEVGQQSAGKLDRSGARVPTHAELAAAAAAIAPSVKAPAKAPAAPALDIGKPGPGHVLTACRVLVVQCVSSPSKSFDACFASAPRCASTQPWLDGGSMACCPQACAQQYEAQRRTGKPPLQAFDLALYGDGSVPGCVPAR